MMARIRTIKPEFFTSDQVAECSTTARLLFVGMWCFSDDGGNHPFSLKRLKMEVFPGDEITEKQISELVDELIANELLISYECEGKAYLHVTGWDTHQKIDKKSFKYPKPNDQNSTTIRQPFDEQEENGCRPLTPGREGKGKEGSGREWSADADHSPNEKTEHEDDNGDDLTFLKAPSPAADEFYRTYPRRIGQRDAAKAFEAAVIDVQASEGLSETDAQKFLIDAAKAYAASPSGRDAADDFRPGPAKWLESGRYRDDRKEWQKPNGRTSKLGTSEKPSIPNIEDELSNGRRRAGVRS